MVFSSVFFIWIFLPIVLLVYYGAYLFCRKNPENQIKADNIILLLAADVLVLESVERYDYKSLIDADYLIQLLSSQP